MQPFSYLLQDHTVRQCCLSPGTIASVVCFVFEDSDAYLLYRAIELLMLIKGSWPGYTYMYLTYINNFKIKTLACIKAVGYNKISFFFPPLMYISVTLMHHSINNK